MIHVISVQLTKVSTNVTEHVRATPSKSMHGLLTSSGGNPGANGRLVGRGTGHRTSPRLGVFRNDNSNVTLYDVKSVALSHLESEREILKVSPYFR